MTTSPVPIGPSRRPVTGDGGATAPHADIEANATIAATGTMLNRRKESDDFRFRPSSAFARWACVGLFPALPVMSWRALILHIWTAIVLLGSRYALGL